MTPDELQVLREKHQPMDDGDGGFYCNYCREEDNEEAWYGWAMGVEWPCDVIKVLDEVDRVMNAAEGYGVVVRAMVEQNSNETITELTTAKAEISEMRKLGWSEPNIARALNRLRIKNKDNKFWTEEQVREHF